MYKEISNPYYRVLSIRNHAANMLFEMERILMDMEYPEEALQVARANQLSQAACDMVLEKEQTQWVAEVEAGEPYLGEDSTIGSEGS